MSTKTQKLDFFPARLQEGDYAWYIIFYQELPNAKPTDKKKRFRRTFGINRIPDLTERRDYANPLVSGTLKSQDSAKRLIV